MQASWIWQKWKQQQLGFHRQEGRTQNKNHRKTRSSYQRSYDRIPASKGSYDQIPASQGSYDRIPTRQEGVIAEGVIVEGVMAEEDKAQPIEVTEAGAAKKAGDAD